MVPEFGSELYEKGIKLAESGDYQGGIQSLQQHLQKYPQDGQACNDIGAMLFCQGDSEQAIEYFQKARQFCGNSAEILWNMSEACIDGGQPEKAAEIFDDMEKAGVLSPDVLNRAANAFLIKDNLAKAMEALYRSFQTVDSQEILLPMMGVIRSKRLRVGFFGSRGFSHSSKTLEYLKTMFNTTAYDGSAFGMIKDLYETNEVLWFDGIAGPIVGCTADRSTVKVVVRLYEQDVCNPMLAQVDRKSVV